MSPRRCNGDTTPAPHTTHADTTQAAHRLRGVAAVWYNGSVELIPTTPFELLVYVVLAAIGGGGAAWAFYTDRVNRRDQANAEEERRDASDKRHEGFYELLQRQYDVTTQQHNAALAVISENTASNVRLCGALDTLGEHLNAQGNAIYDIQTRTQRMELQQQRILAYVNGRTPERSMDTQEAPA